jgi:hypothetical protein
MGSHPQHIINSSLLTTADIVVGVFGTRIGTATPDYISGSVEEIKRHVAGGKLVMLYFSTVPVDPTTLDPKQWAALQSFKEDCRSSGLYAEYGSHEQLRTDFGHHLSLELNKAKYLWLKAPMLVEVAESDLKLGPDEIRILIAAATDATGQIMTGTISEGFYVQTNGENFVEATHRSEAVWRGVLKRLSDAGYIEQVSSDIYELSDKGYLRADKERRLLPFEVMLSLNGIANSPMLVVHAKRPIKVKQLDFLTSSEAQVSTMKLDEEAQSDINIKLDHQ